jgi:hypothetical protein
MTDYPSRSEHGFCSNAFGPIWYTIHLVTLTYPVQPTDLERREYTTWFLLWEKVLPCSICRQNFGDNLKELHFSIAKDMYNRETFSRFVWRLHNLINRKLKKNVTMRWEEFNQFYEKLRADSCSSNSCQMTSVDLRCLLKFVRADSVSPDKLCCIDATCTNNAKEVCLKPLILPSST